ncbi:MAG: DUF1554 domain-containing protein [Leptospirales bacterium]|nr:DUF1554 domain-containing protein [Leptospirales bacterium]HNN73594.1 DUF1554 domain-containing protein [Leptospiraceae bacterium]
MGKFAKSCGLVCLCLFSSCGQYDAVTGYFAVTFLNPAFFRSGGTPGFTIRQSTPCITSEGGLNHTFTVETNTTPGALVTVPVSSLLTTEGVVSPSSVSLSVAGGTQTITVSGVDDGSVDGNQSYTIALGNASSYDPSYNNLSVGSVSCVNLDDEQRRVSAWPLTGLTVAESGTTATFSVLLSSAPASNVIVDVTSLDTTEGTVSPASLTFTPANWSTAQTVTVTGVNDFLQDGSIAYNVALGINAASNAAWVATGTTDTVAVTTTDDDTAGVTVTPTSLSTVESGVAKTFSVVLTSQPTSSVTISAASADTTEGTVAPPSRTFTAGNWNVPQSFTVTPQADAILDGTITYNVTLGPVVSADANYSGMIVSPVSVANADAGIPDIVVSPTSGLVTGEGGVNATFTVVLTQQPSSNVVVGISSSDTTEGTVAPATLTFTNANFATPQTVTVFGVNDAILDGNIAYTIVTAPAVSADPNYSGLNPPDVSVTNNDNDQNLVNISSSTNNLYTTEGGGQVILKVVLSAQPLQDVDVGPITVDDGTEASVSPGTLTFTSANWNVAQDVTVTGLPDAVVDGTIIYHVDLGTTTSTDLNYNGITPTDYNGGAAGQVTIRNADINGATKIVRCDSNSLTTTEAGGTALMFYTLTQAPSANVDIPFSSTDTTEFTVSPATLTFTPANWNTCRQVTLTGVDDAVDDGNQTRTLTIGAATSGDAAFNGIDLADPNVTNNDNDTAGYTVSAISGNTTEAGGTATFTIRLNSKPTNNVTVNLSSSNVAEGTVSPASVTFDATVGACMGGGDWCTNQTVTVTGVNDTAKDGNIGYSIITAQSTADPVYSLINPADVAVTNVDNEKYIFITASTYDGAFDFNASLAGGANSAVNGDGNPRQEMDNACQTDANKPASGTFRALAVDASHRRASLTANLGDSQISWVLSPLYDYIRYPGGATLFTSDANSIFVFGSLTNNFGAGSTYWTGLNGDWTTGSHCTSWTDNGIAVSGSVGDGSSTGSNAISITTNTCDTLKPLICVEQ